MVQTYFFLFIGTKILSRVQDTLGGLDQVLIYCTKVHIFALLVQMYEYCRSFGSGKTPQKCKKKNTIHNGRPGTGID